MAGLPDGAVASALVGALIGAPFGVAASFAAWFIVFRWIVPAVAFGDQISKLPPIDSNIGCRYRIKFRNVGRRGMVDVEVLTRLRVRALSGQPEFSRTWTLVTMQTDTMREPRVPKGANRVVVLDLASTRELQSPLFLRALAGREPSLENVLSLGSRAEVAVWVLAYDEFSGARKAFASKKYSLDDIVLGKFSSVDGLDVVAFADDEEAAAFQFDGEELAGAST